MRTLASLDQIHSSLKPSLCCRAAAAARPRAPAAVATATTATQDSTQSRPDRITNHTLQSRHCSGPLNRSAHRPSPCIVLRPRAACGRRRPRRCATIRSVHREQASFPTDNPHSKHGSVPRPHPALHQPHHPHRPNLPPPLSLPSASSSVPSVTVPAVCSVRSARPAASTVCCTP